MRHSNKLEWHVLHAIRNGLILSQVIGIEQQEFIEGREKTGNLTLVKEIIECCNEKDTKTWMIIIGFIKVHDQIERKQ